jgi:hypothetical protein
MLTIDGTDFCDLRRRAHGVDRDVLAILASSGLGTATQRAQALLLGVAD